MCWVSSLFFQCNQVVNFRFSFSTFSYCSQLYAIMASGRGALAHAGRGIPGSPGFPPLPDVGRGRAAFRQADRDCAPLLGSGICLTPNSSLYTYLGRGRFLLGQILYMAPRRHPYVPRSLEDLDSSSEDETDDKHILTAPSHSGSSHPSGAQCVLHGPVPLDAMTAMSSSVRQMIGQEREFVRITPHPPPPHIRPVSIVHPRGRISYGTGV